MVWMNIQVDAATSDALTRNAQRRGLSVSEYLRLLATEDEVGQEADQAVLRERLRHRIAESGELEPKPTTPGPDSFAAAMTRKYREQGLRG